MDVKPKKKLGQHFLIDKNIANKIVNSLKLQHTNSVLEIGPGKGVLTELIIEKGIKNLYVVDVDPESIEYLKKQFQVLGNNIIYADFLKSDIMINMPSPITIIGNLPYNISSQIMFRVLEHKNIVAEMVCMIQKEVAERFAAKPNSKTYGILSVLLQASYNIEYLFTVSEQVFYPKPKVKSAVIRLERKENYMIDCSEKLFFRVVKTSFGQRRKTIRNSLKTIMERENMNHNLFSKRPEQLSVDDFILLTNFITKNLNR